MEIKQATWNLLSAKELGFISAVSLSLLFGLNIGIRAFDAFVYQLEEPVYDYWPFYITTLDFTGFGDPQGPLFLACSILFFSLGIYLFIGRRLNSLGFVIGFGLILAFLTNFYHGIEYGLVNPRTYGEGTYYFVAQTIDNPLQFISNYAKLQEKGVLAGHPQTHPPGAVLLIYVAYKLTGSVVGASVAISIISLLVTPTFAYLIYRRSYSSDTAVTLVLFLLLIPSIQIYYVSASNAVVASLILLSLYLFIEDGWIKSTAAAISTILVSFLSFVFVYLLPIYLGYELITKRNIRRTSLVVMSVASVYLVMYLTVGFNYFEVFSFASSVVNDGFMLFSSPVTYFITRLENILDILYLFSPFLTVLAFKKIRNLQAYREPFFLFGLGVGTLLAMFATGVYNTGETARGAIYIYPFLLLPVGAYLEKQESSSGDIVLLCSLLFIQTVVIQWSADLIW